MLSRILYAYVEGSDLVDLADEINARFLEFTKSRKWAFGDIWHVNKRQLIDRTHGPEDLPDWDLGLNLRLPSPGSEPVGWFSDVVAIVQFLGVLHHDIRRGFVIGICDEDTKVSDDLFFVGSSEPDLAELRNVIGVGDVE